MLDVKKDRAFKLIRAAFREAVADPRVQETIDDCVVICQYHIEDVDLWWVIELNRGKIRFHEGRVEYAGIIFKYRHAVDFHLHVTGEPSRVVKWETGFECFGNRALRKYTSPVWHAMREVYRRLVAAQEAPAEDEKKPARKSKSKKAGTV